jgi:2,4-dienoyl-CoA reductase-like NADH-dependent reductase (Old Yellow Enzyme family)
LPNIAYAPSAIPYNDHRRALPKAMTKEDIEAFKVAFVASIKHALAVGFDSLEIHNAHSYLLHKFLSPDSNKRTDE